MTTATLAFTKQRVVQPEDSEFPESDSGATTKLKYTIRISVPDDVDRAVTSYMIESGLLGLASLALIILSYLGITHVPVIALAIATICSLFAMSHSLFAAWSNSRSNHSL